MQICELKNKKTTFKDIIYKYRHAWVLSYGILSHGSLT